MARRLLGLDLGIASAHTAVVLAEDAAVICRRRAIPTVDSLTVLERDALAGAPPDTCLEVVIEPTGPAWLPVAVFFGGRGHTVYRVSSQKAADLRRFLHRHAKTNSIDADTLARLPLVDPDGLHPVELPSAARAGLDRRVRACDRLTQTIATHKKRIRDLAAQLMPTIQTALGRDLGRADLAVLERYGDPHAMIAAGRTRLARLITRASNGHLDAGRADGYLACAAAALALYADDPAVAYSDLADELASEIRLLRATQAELDRHAAAREAHYQQVDPEQLARSLPGIATVGGPLVVAALGRPGRFATGAQVRAYTGLTPRASETGQTDRKGQPMSKAGSARLRTLLLRAADVARTQDPQLAKLYYTQMVDRGATHLKALCVVAAHLAERIWVVLGRGRPYVVCDPDGRPVSPAQAKQLIAEHFTVPDEVRRRRRSNKTGKAPHQVLAGHAVRAQGATRRPSPAPILAPVAQPVKPRNNRA
jgi:transposase